VQTHVGAAAGEPAGICGIARAFQGKEVAPPVHLCEKRPTRVHEEGSWEALVTDRQAGGEFPNSRLIMYFGTPLGSYSDLCSL